MDKPSEQRKSHKGFEDTDVGVHNFGIGNNREQLNGIWGVASEKIVGLSPTRVITNVYSKKEGKPGVNVKMEDKKDLVDSILESGPPLINMSRIHRIF